ncbi:SubName: Full=Uncharacterized protein {ECO:0000313/EMBL:CCA66535.1} [Serendipita indica DSM 11827]|nr:SubName: Full=Uncharacterized protein {ECO:0000313/EMBL:CCA66535.1} [Serendipita indica DSM 11827]
MPRYTHTASRQTTDGAGSSSGSKLEFEIIDGEKRMRDVFNKPWEVCYLKFRNAEGSLLPVKVKFATLVEDEPEEEPQE